MKILWVGDPHATPDELDDCQRLMTHVKNVAQSEKVDAVVLGGDLHHTFSVVRLEVSHFWESNLEDIAQICSVFALVGNHDQQSDTEKEYHALELYKSIPGVTVVDRPMVVGGIAYIPHFRHEADFLSSVAQLPRHKTIFCHQTFNGAAYENGMFAPDGFSFDGLECDLIVGGHIHSPQAFAKVWYPGAPRWRTVADAKTDSRAIFVLTVEEDGTISDRSPRPTNGVCRSMYEVQECEGEPEMVAKDIPNSVPVVSLHGTRAWVESRSVYWRGFGAHISPSFAGEKVQIRESDGVLAGMLQYCEDTDPKFGSNKEELASLIRSRFDGFSR